MTEDLYLKQGDLLHYNGTLGGKCVRLVLSTSKHNDVSLVKYSVFKIFYKEDYVRFAIENYITPLLNTTKHNLEQMYDTVVFI